MYFKRFRSKSGLRQVEKFGEETGLWILPNFSYLNYVGKT
jgi:hypothetical protein